VQKAITNRITKELFDYLDLEALAQEATGALAGQLERRPRASAAIEGLAGPIADGVEGFVRTQVGKAVASDQFEQAWTEANRVAHGELVKALSGESRSLVVEGDTVRVDLAAFLEVVKQRLSKAGLPLVDKMPEVHPTFELLATKDLVRMQTAYQWLDRLAWLLPVLSIGLVLLGVFVAPGHRGMLLGGALGFAASMLLLAAGLAIGRAVYLDALPEGTSADAAAILFDTLVRFIRYGLRLVLVVALVVALGAYLVGPSKSATMLRSSASKGIGRLRAGGESAGLHTGPVGRWIFTYRNPLRVGVVAVAALVLVFWDNPTPAVVIAIAVVLLLALAVIELLGRPPAEPGVS
jgi:hypothetical protein